MRVCGSSIPTAACKDANSRFGTFLNGELIETEVDGSTRRHDQARRGRADARAAHVDEAELLSEQHQVSEGPGTILPIGGGGAIHGAVVMGT